MAARVIELTEPYVIGLLSDLDVRVPALRAQLETAHRRAGAVDAELSNLLMRLDDSKRGLKEAQAQSTRCGLAINDGNMQVATLHQEMATLRRKVDDIGIEMERVGRGAIQRRLRKERAKFSVQIEDREAEIVSVRETVERERLALAAADETVSRERDRLRALTLELDKLQAQLPNPYLYAQLFAAVAARSHCDFFLDADAAAWGGQLRQAIDLVVALHEALRAGKYRLDKNSELVGGRDVGTAEALYAAVALGDTALAERLFALATDPSLFFHQIFNVFRVWCLGLYVTKQHQQLRELLRLHQYAPGLRGGYVQAFIGLLTREQRRIAIGIKEITKHEWELWQDASVERGLGVVNLGAVALGRLALDAGLPVTLPGPTVPEGLIAAG